MPGIPHLDTLVTGRTCNTCRENTDDQGHIRVDEAGMRRVMTIFGVPKETQDKRVMTIFGVPKETQDKALDKSLGKDKER